MFLYSWKLKGVTYVTTFVWNGFLEFLIKHSPSKTLGRREKEKRKKERRIYLNIPSLPETPDEAPVPYQNKPTVSIENHICAQWLSKDKKSRTAWIVRCNSCKGEFCDLSTNRPDHNWRLYTFILESCLRCNQVGNKMVKYRYKHQDIVIKLE